MSLSTKCLHVSSTLCLKAELVLCGGTLNGGEKEQSCNFCQKYCQEVILGLKQNEREKGESHLSQNICYSCERSLTFGIKVPPSNSSLRAGLHAKF